MVQVQPPPPQEWQQTMAATAREPMRSAPSTLHSPAQEQQQQHVQAQLWLTDERAQAMQPHVGVQPSLSEVWAHHPQPQQ